MRRWTLLALVAVMWAAPGAFAWGQIGHRIVCQIALGELEGGQRRELDRLARLYRKHGVSYPSYAHACFFPDQIKTRPAFTKFRKTHFVNVPRTAKTVNVEDSSCVDQLCVLEGIELHRGKVSSASRDVNRAEALFFLGHWLGDVHQPLHVSFADDTGGNDVVVVSGFYPEDNLHSVWDTGIIRAAMGNAGWRAYADELQASITAAQRTEWLGSEPLDWAQESYEITLLADVDYCEPTSSRCRGEEHDRELTADYQELHDDTVERRLQQAGVRLAEELRRLLFSEE